MRDLRAYLGNMVLVLVLVLRLIPASYRYTIGSSSIESSEAVKVKDEVRAI